MQFIDRRPAENQKPLITKGQHLYTESIISVDLPNNF